MKDEQRVFIRGVEGRGDEVIKMLEEHGGKNCHVDGADSECLYFIDHEGLVSLAIIDSEFGKIIMDNYTDLHLPEKWRDGDVLVDRYDSQVMALYEFVSDKDADLFNAYFRIDDNMIFSHSLEVRERFRSATEQEIERFYKILHEHHKDWDAENKCLVDWQWKPKENDSYYCVDVDGDITDYTWDGDGFDADCYNFGNCFHTREEAEAMAERIKKLLKGE